MNEEHATQAQLVAVKYFMLGEMIGSVMLLEWLPTWRPLAAPVITAMIMSALRVIASAIPLDSDQQAIYPFSNLTIEGDSLGFMPVVNGF